MQTQFTYLDVGVNIDITPTVHYDREVALKLKIEVLSQAGSVTISGVTEPVIGQRSSEQFIPLQDGEPSLLSGIITKRTSSTSTALPASASSPSSSTSSPRADKNPDKTRSSSSLVPHIVRESVLTRANTRAIDTGTGGSFELRRDASAGLNDSQLVGSPARPRPAQPTSAANAASAMAQQLRSAD